MPVFTGSQLSEESWPSTSSFDGASEPRTSLAQVSTYLERQDSDPVHVTSHKGSHHSPSKTRIVSSMAYHGDPTGAATLPEQPPNTPYDPSQFTKHDIDEIRKLTSDYAASGSASTPASQISCPDHTDGRLQVDMQLVTDDIVIRSTPKVKKKIASSPRSTKFLSEPPSTRSRSKSPCITHETKTAESQEVETEHVQEHAHSVNPYSSEGTDKIVAMATDSDRISLPTEINQDHTPSKLSNLPPKLVARTKTEPLQPQESSATATNVELAVELSPSMRISPDYMDAQKAKAREEAVYFEPSIYDMFQKPLPQSNSLGTGVEVMR